MISLFFISFWEPDRCCHTWSATMTIPKSPQEDLCVDHLVVRKHFTHLYDCELRNKVSLTRCQVILQRFRNPNKSFSHKQDPKIFDSSQAKLHWGLCELTTQGGSHWVLEVCSWILEFGDVIVIPRCFGFNHAVMLYFQLVFSSCGQTCAFIFSHVRQACLLIVMSSPHIFLPHTHYTRSHTP